MNQIGEPLQKILFAESLVNKGTTQQIVNLQMAKFKNPRSYYRYVLTGGTDNGNFSRKVYVNGESPSGEGGGPANYADVKSMAPIINGDINFIRCLIL